MVCQWLRSPSSRYVVLALVLLGFSSLLAAQTAPFVYAYDEAGRLVGVVDAAGNTTTYTYDALGNIVSIVRGTSAVSILEFTPNSGPAGTNVTITGAGFSGTVSSNTVTFNGVTATVLSATPNQMVAVVPAGATTGPIRVTSPAGSAVSATSFIVAPGTAPTLSSFTPAVGAPGSAVTISGTNFETVPGGNKVSFNGNLGIVSSATATTLGAMVSASATSGHITVTTPNGRATSSGDFFVPPSPYTATDVEVTGRMAIGDIRAVTITQAGKIGLLVFDGTAGQRIALSVALGTGLSGGGCDSVSIRRPDGAYLVSPTSLCSASNFVDMQVLPTSGTYTIAFDPVGTDTGTATLTLHNVPPDTAAPIVPGGSPVTLTTTVPGQNAAATFSGTAGQRVSLNVGFGSGLTASCNTVSIQNPDGTALLGVTTTCGTSYFTDVLTLPATGTYTVKVNPGGTGTGTLTLTLYSVPADASGSLVAGGSALTLTISAPGQNAAATFSGTAGQRVSLNVGFGTGLTASCNTVSIQNPDGTALLGVTTTCGTSYFTDVLTLPATGTYTVKVNPAGTGAGTITLTLYSVPADASGSLVAGGSALTLTISAPGQNAAATFSGTAGQRVSLNIGFGSGLTASCNTVSIQNPDGTALLGVTTTCGTSYFTDVLTLPATGTYTVEVNPGGTGTGTGTLTLTLYSVPADASGSLVAGGSALTLTISAPGQNAAATFSGTAGQRVSLNVGFGTGLTASCNTVSIQNPDGTALLGVTTTCGTSYFTDVLTLPATGTYTVKVNPGGTGTGTLTLTLYSVPADASGSLVTGGSALTLTISAPGQNAASTFSGTAGQRVSLTVGFGTGLTALCNTVSIQNPDGTALLGVTTTCGTSYFTDVLTLPATGTYTVKVNPGGTGTGTLTLTLYSVPADATGSLVAGGSPVTVTTTAPGQNAQLTFSGSSGQRVSLNVSFGTGMTSSCNSVSIQNPSGTALLGATTTCGTTYFTDVLTLSATGTHTVTVNPGGLNTGSTTLTLYSVPADATATITVNGTAAGVTTTAPGQNAVVSFSGTAAQSVTVRLTGNTVGFVAVTLRKPDGSTLTSTSSSAASFNLAAQTLPVSGTYTILVNPSGISTGSINVATTSP